MTLLVRDAAQSREITSVFVVDAGSVSREISEIRVRDSNNVSRVVFSTGSPLSASADPPDVFGYDAGTGTAVSNSTTVTATGGSAPYTYLWTVFSYTGITPPLIGDDTQDTTNFTQTGLSPGQYTFAVFLCTVTDDNDATTEVYVTASFFSEGIVP